MSKKIKLVNSAWYVLVGLVVLVVPMLLWADGDATAPAATPGAPGEPPGIVGMLVPFALMFGVVYFLMIRPQQKKMKEHQDLLGSLKSGDEVVTTSGILGKISGMAEKVVTLEIADNVRVKILKSQIAQVTKGQVKDLT